MNTLNTPVFFAKIGTRTSRKFVVSTWNLVCFDVQRMVATDSAAIDVILQEYGGRVIVSKIDSSVDSKGMGSCNKADCYIRPCV